MKKALNLWLAAVLAAGLAMIQFGCGGGGGDGGNGGPLPLPEVAVLTNQAASLWATDVVEKLEATGKFSRVDTVNTSSTPSLSQLLTYDGVLIYTGTGPDIADTTALGDLLADFVERGGGLVVAFAAVVDNPSFPEFALGGRYVLDQYYLIPRVDSTFTPGSLTSGAVLDSSHPIMAGFTSFHGGSPVAWADTTQVMPGATVILEWANGVPLVITGDIDGVRRVDLNFFPPSSDSPDSRLWVATTDGDKLMANSLTWVANWP